MPMERPEATARVNPLQIKSEYSAKDALIEAGLKQLESPEVKEFALDGIRNGFVDQSLLTTNPEYFNQLFPIYEVAKHEAGHEVNVRANGDFVKSTTVIRSGNTLGAVTWVSNQSDTERHSANVISASHGGEAVEELFGHNHHHGSGSDRGKERIFSRILSRITGESASNIWSRYTGLAKARVRDYGINYFKRRAWYLALKGTVA